VTDNTADVPIMTDERFTEMMGWIAIDPDTSFDHYFIEAREALKAERKRALTAEANVARMFAALLAIEEHHIAINRRIGRPLDKSKTLRLAREGLALRSEEEEKA
jgi:hypothetical protein